MIDCGLKVEAQHHEVASGGQGEIDMRYAPLVEMADNVLKYKYIVKNVARKHGKTATFMPKPIFLDNGSGMHVHTSLWKDGKNLFAGSGYAGLTETAELMGWRRYPARLGAPLTRALLKRRSPYFRYPGRYADPWGVIEAKWESHQ